LPGLPLADAIEAFRQNKAGFIHLPQPAAERLIAEGVGHLVAALGTENGHIAYSSFAATTAFLTNHAETVSRFVQGFSRALQWLESNDESDIADAISEFFDETPKELLTKSIGRYKAQGTWPTNPGLEQPEYEGLQEILMAAGLVKEHQPYHKVVTREFA
jgi:NitT/TauT family transport system substrate-binding protein